MTQSSLAAKPTLVLGGRGKTGRRVVQRLTTHGLPVRLGSRSGQPPFDGEDHSTWAPALRGVGAAYISYYPDLAVPGAMKAVRAFADLAVEQGVGRLVLLSGRGEEEAQQTEREVHATGAELTIVRRSGRLRAPCSCTVGPWRSMIADRRPRAARPATVDPFRKRSIR